MTQKLTAHNFERAKSFIRSNARTLDRRFFEFHFESGPASAVMEELAKFQNADMGFGNALEADFRLPKPFRMLDLTSAVAGAMARAETTREAAT